jgi:hypothetical protein
MYTRVNKHLRILKKGTYGDPTDESWQLVPCYVIQRYLKSY